MTVGLRERKKLKTRELIVSTALDLFAVRGYHHTTVADIAEQAEIAERTVFTYFPSKEDILFSDHAELRDGLAAALEARPEGESALAALRAFAVESLSPVDEQSRLRWQIVSQDEHLLSHQRGRHAELAETIAAAIAADLDEELDDFRLQLVTAAVTAAITAVYEHRYGVRSRTASRAQAIAVIDEAIAFLRGGLEAIRSFPRPY